MKLLLLFATAGFFFGTWPILMNKSQLPGFAAAAVFAGLSFMVVLPVAMASGQLQHVRLAYPLLFALGAAIFSSVGLLAFTTGLSEVSVERVSSFFIVMLMAQLSVPAIHQMFVSGDISIKRIVGIAGAFVVAYLLTS